jgi:YidC/Oxa1 family membrane protein insertase
VGRTIVVETPLYRAEFSNLGAALTSLELKRYASAHPGSHAGVRHARPGEDVPPADRVRLAGEPTFELGLGSGLAARPLRDIAYAVAESLDAAGAVRTLTFTGQAGSGTEVRQTYRVHPDSYAIDLAVEIRNPPASDTDYTLTLRSWPAETEADRVSDQRALRASSLVGTNIHREHAAGLLRQPKIFEGNVVWAGVQSRYFLVAAAILEGASRAVVSNAEERGPVAGEAPGPGPGGAYVLAVNRVAMTLPSASRPVHRFVLFAGPSEYAQLARLSGTQLERAVDLGWNWVRPISSLLLRVLNAIHSVVRNYGFAIILLATLLRALLHPLNMAGMKSMRAMQKIQPEMDRIRAKYKDDPQAMNTAVMALYKENKVNPAGGCLPMLLQMPVLISLYQVLFNAIELRQAPFLGWMSDLSAPDLLFAVASFPIRLLPVLMAGSGFLLQRLTPTTPQQAPTAYMMNLMMLVFFYNMPSGLVLYWTVMNLLSALQQWLVLRHE